MIDIAIIVLCSIIAGLLNGAREATHAESDVFEKRFGADKYGFFGSQSWQRKYVGYDNEKGERSWAYTLISDYWHVSAWVRKALLLGAMVVVGYNYGVSWQLFVYPAAIWALDAAAASVAYGYMRTGKIKF